MKLSKGNIIILIFVVVLLIIKFGVLYTVNEGQNALLLRLGEIVTKNGSSVIIKPGLHFKLPILNQVAKLDMRLQTLTVDSSRVLTAEQKYLLVDYYAKWRISDPALYYTRTGGIANRADTLLQQKINDALRAAFGQRTVSEVVSGERLNIMELLKAEATKSAQQLGITVTDVRIKAIDLPKEVSDSVFARMRTDREKVAAKHRADGQSKAEAIRAQADANVTVVLAQAQEKAALIRAAGDAKAADVYADAYSKEPEFYAFYRSLLAYKQVFNSKNDLLILKPDNEFFKYFNNIKSEKTK